MLQINKSEQKVNLLNFLAAIGGDCYHGHRLGKNKHATQTNQPHSDNKAFTWPYYQFESGDDSTLTVNNLCARTIEHTTEKQITH